MSGQGQDGIQSLAMETCFYFQCVMFGNGNAFPGNWFPFPGFVRFENGNVFPGNWFPFPGPPIFSPGSF